MYSPTLFVLLFFRSGFNLAQDFCQCTERTMKQISTKNSIPSFPMDLYPTCSCSLTSLFACSFPTVFFVASPPSQRAECSVACLGCASARRLLPDCCQAEPTMSEICQPLLEETSVWISLVYFAADFQDLYKNLMIFETLTGPSELVKIDQQIQKLSGTDGQHACKSLISIQATQYLNSDLVLNNLCTVLLFGCCSSR